MMNAVKLLLAVLVTLMAAPLTAASVKDLPLHSTVQGSGATIIFVHGWTCDESSWSRQIAEFARDYRVVTLDLPGHGRSAAPAQADFSMDLFADAVEAVRKEIGAKRVILVGHSMGARVIRQYALRYPRHVAGLVAVDGLLDVRLEAGNVAPTGVMTQARRVAAIDGMFVDGTPAVLREEIRTMMLAAPEATALGAAAAMSDPALRSSRIISAPAMTVWASTRKVENYTRTRELVPQWQAVQLPGTGHFLMMEQPAQFNALLRSFIEQRAKF